jgi:hypothetical protein
MAGEKKYFLGIGGEQSGPFTEAEVNGKISSGEAKADTLIWYEGLGEWQRVDAIAFFQSAFKKGKTSSGVTLSKSPSTSAPTPEGSDSDVQLRPVFSSQEAVFYKRQGPKPIVLVAAAAALFLGGGLLWYLDSDSDDSIQVGEVAYKKDLTTRPARLRKAESDYLLNPVVVPDDFLKLVTENSKDDVGSKAAAALENIYKKKNRPRELAELYIKLGRFAEAVSPLVESKAYAEANQAATQAYTVSSEKSVRYKMLVTSIELLTTQLLDLPQALPKIAQLEKEFPGEPNPFSYYLLSDEKKMADLFNRTSYFFVESLLAHLKAEFPEVKLAGRPLVSIVREPGAHYRIAGSYKGEVQLKLDKLRNIRFEYWMVGADWYLVSTNITSARGEWARGNRGKYLSQTQSSQGMLSYLEGIMRAQFPGLGLHKKPSREQLTTAARDTASAK